MDAKRTGEPRSRKAFLLAALVASVGTSIGCSQTVDTILQVGEGSGATITLGALELETGFTGGVDSTVEIDISFLDLLFGRPLDGTVTINEILIAGSEIVIAPGLTTGTLCVSPLDPADPGGGTLEIDLKHRELTLAIASQNGVVATDPVLGPSLGVLEFPVEISSTSPVSLIDLLGALGGGGLPLDVTQEFEIVIDEGPFTGATVSGVITLEEADAFPGDPLVLECEAFLAGP